MKKTDPQTFLSAQLTPGQQVICAVSGGLDSMCLLHMVVSLGYMPIVAHYHHGLRKTADRDADFVAHYCAEQNIACLVEYGDVETYSQETGQGLEAAGRTLRYAFFRALSRKQGDLPILTAHHGTDNAETMLFHLLRGTGMRGLCGIPHVNQNILRPLLSLSRGDLADYAAENHIPFVEDETNQDERFSRNRLRHQVLPILQGLNPQAIHHFYQTSQQLRQEDAYLTDLAKAQLPPQVGTEISLPWELLDSPLAPRMVLLALEQLCGQRQDLTASHVEGVLNLRHTPGRITLAYGMHAAATPTHCILTAPPPKPCTLVLGETATFGAWEICYSEAPQRVESLPCHGEAVSLTLRSCTARDWLEQGGKNRSVKRRLRDQGLPHTTPVVSWEGGIVAVAELGLDQQFMCKQGDIPNFYITFTNKGATT